MYALNIEISSTKVVGTEGHSSEATDTEVVGMGLQVLCAKFLRAETLVAGAGPREVQFADLVGTGYVFAVSTGARAEASSRFWPL